MKTIICDIDGTLTEYMDGGHKAIMEQEHVACPGVVDKMRNWEANGHRIILITGRRESVRQRTENELRRLGIPFDVLLMGYADRGRYLINDISPYVGNKAHAINITRDGGFENIKLDNIGK